MSAPSVAGGAHTVRRLVLYSLLLTLVIVAASGLSGLLWRLFDTGSQLAGDDSAGLAQSLAFTLVAGPLAVLLWWFIWRSLSTQGDRRSVLWGVYLLITTVVAIMVATTSLLDTVSAAIGRGQWLPDQLATGVVWAGIWSWHQWMLAHRVNGPTRLADAPAVLASLFGLLLTIVNGVAALAVLFDAAFVATTELSGGHPWWRLALASLVWAAGGAALWWWYWFRRGTRMLDTGFARVVLVVITGFIAPLTCLGGLATLLYVALHFGADALNLTLTDSASELIPEALAAAGVGAVAWLYHRTVVAGRAAPVREATRLVASALTLAAAATGVGVIVNSALAVWGVPLAGGGVGELLLGGLSAFIIGGVAWWLVWAPTRQDAQGSGGRHVYLVVIFGLSAIVALITVLVIAFRLFDFVLAEASTRALLDRIRAPLGLLTATALVAGYHFALWRAGAGSREASAAPVRRLTVVVTEGTMRHSDADALRRGIARATGANVAVWQSPADPVAVAVPHLDAPGETDAAAHSTALAADDLVRDLIESLAGVRADHLLAIVRPHAAVELLPIDESR